MALPAFWCTAIAKALSGDQPCQLSTWIGGRTKEKRPREDTTSLAIWKTNHTEQLNAAVAAMREHDWKCSVEKFWTVTGQSAVISGKADCVAYHVNNRPIILDVKSGKPRESDVIQVAIYMVMIPLAWESPSMIFEGRVLYNDHAVTVTPDKAAELKPKVFALLKQLGTMPRPQASPSLSACRFCDVPDSECAERFQEASDPQQAHTEMF